MNLGQVVCVAGPGLGWYCGLCCKLSESLIHPAPKIYRGLVLEWIKTVFLWKREADNPRSLAETTQQSDTHLTTVTNLRHGGFLAYSYNLSLHVRRATRKTPGERVDATSTVASVYV